VYEIHHPKAVTDRPYVKRKEGGRGLLQNEATYKAQIVKYCRIFEHKIFRRPVGKYC
jgi:hypothetical protein